MSDSHSAPRPREAPPLARLGRAGRRVRPAPHRRLSAGLAPQRRPHRVARAGARGRGVGCRCCSPSARPTHCRDSATTRTPTSPSRCRSPGASARFRASLFHAGQQLGACFRVDPRRDPRPRMGRLPRAARRPPRGPARRARDPHRRDRVGQDDDAGDDREPAEPGRRLPHHHRGGAGRVPLPATCPTRSSRSARSASTC